VDVPRLPIEPVGEPDPDPEPTLRVSELTSAVQVALDVCFPDEVWVRGEISSLSRPPSGHVYFQLIEPGPTGAPPVARLAVTLFASDKVSVNATLKRVRGVRMTDGVEIRLRGRIGVYGPQGQLQLRMTAIDPEYTLGRLASERERILLALEAEGLLARNARLALAARPVRIGLVTSAGSAAEADFLHELSASGLSFTVLAADARVQGNGADRSVARAMRRVVAAGVDVVAIVRGGGSRTDLAAFDSELLARAIATVDCPVLTGVGHEVDTSVADRVAHTACKTPTAAAAFLAGRAESFHARVDHVWIDVGRLAADALQTEAARVDRCEVAAARAGTAAVTVAARRLDERSRRLSRAATRSVEPQRLRLASLQARVAALDPARALARGWSITRTADGRLVREPGDVTAGTELVTTLAGGALRSRVVDPSPPSADEPS
jgi:exodeoxyribonuclease VII large subunit